METNSSAPAGELAGRREWIGLAVLALPTLLLSLDLSVLLLAIPHVTADLQPTSSQMLWIVDIYGFMIAGFLVTMGNLGDRIGRRRLLMIGAATFGVASVVAAYSTSAEMLIAARAVLGIAGATLMPTVLALISNMFRDAKQRAVAISMWMSCFMVGMAIGPLVGGLMLSWFWWGSVFLLGLPVMALLLVVAPILLPEYRHTGAGRLDPASVAISLAAVLPVIYGLKELARGSSVWVPTLVLVIGLAFGAAFVRRQRRLADPLLDVRLLSRPAFSGALGIMLLGGATISGTVLTFTAYLQWVQGLSPLVAGLWLIPYTVGMIVGSMLAPRLAQKARPATVIAGGMVISVVGYLLLTQVSVTGGGLVVAVIGTVIATGGLAPMVVLGTGLVVGSAPPEKAGAASSVSQTSNELGVALGIAILGSIGTAVYRGNIAVPNGVPPEVASAARAGVAEGTAAAADLPGELGDTLRTAIHEAFTTGFAVSALVSAAIVAVLATLAVVLFRHVRIGGDAPDGSAPPTDDTAPDDVPAGEPAT